MLSAARPLFHFLGKTPANPGAGARLAGPLAGEMMSNDEFFRADGGLFAGKSKTYGNSGERK